MTGERERRTPSGQMLRLVPPASDDAAPVRDARRAPDPDRDRLVVPVERRSVAVGRHWVVRSAAERGVLGMANQVVELLSSELLANAVLHGPQDGEITVEVVHGDGTVRVSVGDGGPRSPVVLHREPAAANGRGMAIVEAMSTRWGVVEGDDGGKTVWFELDLDDF